jgi:hypothetical protein
VRTVILARESPNIQSCTVQIYRSSQLAVSAAASYHIKQQTLASSDAGEYWENTHTMSAKVSDAAEY